MDADGGSPGLLVDKTPGQEILPDWSPDGAQILFSYVDGGKDIYRMNADGSGEPTPLTDAYAADHWYARWSPDGSQIAVMVDTGNVDIHLMDASGANSTPFASDPGEEGGPAWSPFLPTGDPPELSPTVPAAAPTPGEVLPTGTTSTPLTVTITDHAAPGHWHWQLDTPFWATGVAGGNHVEPEVLTDTIAALVDDASYTTYVALVSDAAHNLLDENDGADSRASVSFSVASAAVTGVDVAVPDSMGRPGGTVSIPIEVTGMVGLDVIGIALDVAYDATILTPTDDGANTTAAVFWSGPQNLVQV